MQCDLWHIPSGNMIACFDSESEALAEARALVRAGEPLEALSMTIYPASDGAFHLYRRADSEAPVVVEGPELAERLRTAFPADPITV
jgi:hypothetical protein